ncbi:MAG: sulfite exporter TauE/SafE family protein [Bacteroidetes bacterium]|nr:sulfite exporter TauE/SafE family protein [Bacteroidota bacterium]
MEILGYIGAVLMGLSLGLIGGGGSILTVPILVYLFQVDAVLATAYSLFIVGLTSLVGSFSHIKLGNIHWRTAIVFGIPSIISVFLTRSFLVPRIPDPIMTFGQDASGGAAFVLTKSVGLLLLFAVIMVMAAYSMIKPSKKASADQSTVVESDGQQPKFNYPLILSEGAIVGVVTGLVGAGGGFLIIPALVLLAKLPMKQAVGTSLMIIAAKSLIGFVGDMRGNEVIDWSFLAVFSSIAVVGILIGSWLSKRIPGEKLKPAFGWFVLVMGTYIIIKELF